MLSVCMFCMLSTPRSCLVHRAVSCVMQGYFCSVWNICAVFQVRSVQKQYGFYALAATLNLAMLAADCGAGLLPATFSSVFQ